LNREGDKKNSTVNAAAPHSYKIGHNGGPSMEPFGLRARWLKFANDLELRRLAKLHMRIERKQAGLQALVKERQKIMQRCIRRMRREAGKDRNH